MKATQQRRRQVQDGVNELLGTFREDIFPPCFLPPHPSPFGHQVDFLFLLEVSLSGHAVFPVVLSGLPTLFQDPYTTRITTTWEMALFIFFHFLKRRSFVSAG